MDTNEMHLILKNSALVDLPKLFETMKTDHIQELCEVMESHAVWLIRASAYLESRVEMQGHDSAVKAQNKVAAKVRRAMGYTYPRNDITW